MPMTATDCWLAGNTLLLKKEKIKGRKRIK